MRRIAQLLVGSLTVIGSLFVAPEAFAGLEACGNINVSAEAQCEVVVEGGCTARCTPIAFEAACYGKCEGGCSGTVNAQCTTDCSASCQADCQADPGSFDCEGQCRGNCQADCSGSCSARTDPTTSQAECEASCKANCGGECAVQCEGTPPSASCEAQCGACCSGECTAEANFECQVDCQGGCTAELTGGCEVQCETPDGALFCDGQFVDAGNNLANCVAALNAILNVKVSGYADASCEGGSCQAEAGVNASCAVPVLGSPVDGRAQRRRRCSHRGCGRHPEWRECRCFPHLEEESPHSGITAPCRHHASDDDALVGCGR